MGDSFYLPRKRRRPSRHLLNASVYARHGREFMGWPDFAESYDEAQGSPFYVNPVNV